MISNKVLPKEEMFSLYIPNIPHNLGLDRFDETILFENDKETLTAIFNSLNIGLVDRVDIVIKPNNGQNHIIAFVHFKEMYNNEESTRFRQEIHGNGIYTLEEVSIQDKTYYLSKRKNDRVPRSRAFITIKKNTSPIPTINEADYPLNIHQLVDINKTLVEENFKLHKRILELEEKIQDQNV